MESKLNLGGSRGWSMPGWVNLDIGFGYDLNKQLLKGYADGSIELIYFSHTLEHLPWPTVPLILNDCHRVLQMGGTIRIIVPDVDILCRFLESGDKEEYMSGNPSYYGNSDNRDRLFLIDIIEQLGFYDGGNKRVPFLHGFHKSFFSWSILYILLREAGFTRIDKGDYLKSSVREMQQPPVMNKSGMPTSGFDNPYVQNISLYVECVK